jgi:hypothetical protein
MPFISDRKGDKVFNLFFMKGEEEDVILQNDTWDEHWFLDNDRFEKVL